MTSKISFDHNAIEKKWREKWAQTKLYKTPELHEGDEKYYSLYSFPYPSGSGLHVGHAEGMVANDIMARFYRMNGRKVTLPMGWDSFGLPAENYAIKTGVHPKESTEEAIATFIDQIDRLGISVDWEKEVGAHRPDYYKWTQWFFTELYRHGLAYKATAPVNWCPKDQTVLANEQVIDGKCERCDSEVERKDMEQWFFKITEYAERLGTELDNVDWPEPTKLQQRNWIGRSEGALVDFDIKDSDEKLKVFTTRPDTLFGCTFMVISPEHKLIEVFKDRITNYAEIQKYILQAKKKSNLERTDLNKDKNGIKIEGISALNPVNNREVPIFVADYVLVEYGTGAIMAVPAHDERDYDFAIKYGLEIIEVVEPKNKAKSEEKFFADDGIVINSGDLNGLETKEAKAKIISLLEQQKQGKKNVNYRLKDWLISRQRYWGAPIPVIWRKRENPDKVTFIHGIGSSSQSNWLPWLQESLAKELPSAEIINQNFPNADMPVLEEWLSQVELQNLTEESSIVAHSLGGFVALKYAQTHKLKQLVLVAPTNTVSIGYWDQMKKDNPDFPIEYLQKNFYNNDLDVERITSNVNEIVMIFSSDDPYVNQEVQEQFKNQFEKYDNVEIKSLFNRHHMGAAVNCTKLPEVFDYFMGKQYRVLRENDLPLMLPDDVDFIPKGYSPLSRSEEYSLRIKKKYGEEWTPEFDTMDTFVCSSWYYFRFCDPKNTSKIASSDLMNGWLPADLYMIGAEHIVLHLLYARFFTKFLNDLGKINFKEPFLKMRHMGIIAGPDGRKMSKRWGNVINPNDVVNQYGADTLRVYEMFMGPLDQGKAWNDNSVAGVRRFLDRIWNISNSDFSETIKRDSDSESIINIELNKLIKKVTEDTIALKFNTSVAKFMEFINLIEAKIKEGNYSLTKDVWEKFIVLLSPYAPYITEEIWQQVFGHKDSIHLEKWLEYDKALLSEQKITIAVQIMGKTRGSVEIDPNLPEDQIVEFIREDVKLNKYFGSEIKKVIYIAGKIINFII